MRRFEMNDGGASKFWEVDVDGSAVVVRFGRIGAAGQRKEKTLATAEAARAEAEKLVREKLGKGYVEIGGGAAERPTKASAKAPTTATTPALARPTGRFGWTEEIDALFARGFPYLRELTDAVVSPKEAAREAKKGCQAIDPYFPVRLPRDVAARYLRGYAFHPFEEVEAQARAIDADRAIDGAYLREILATKFAPAPDKRRETYVFRIQEVLFLFEAFLGTEEVVAAAVEHLVRARVHPDAWTPDGSAFFVDHSNSNAARLVAPLGWLRLRLDPARWQALVAPLRGSNARLPEFSARLAALVDDAAPARQDEIAIAMQRRDAAPLRRSL
ncbi:MAG TPA: WGR domain-containing protein, partial [Minicystis sp.]|nr:WGR domain-containing protein [Minicystis sp.]